MSEGDGMTCGTCKHWNQKNREDYTIVVESDWESNLPFEEREKAADEADMHYGHCRAINHGRVTVSTDPLPLAITMDGSDYMSSLYTRENFGCVLHEAKESE